MKPLWFVSCFFLAHLLSSFDVSASRTFPSYYDPLRFYDVIVRGVVQSREVVTVGHGEWRRVPAEIANKDIMIFAVHLDVTEVLRGSPEQQQLTFYQHADANVIGATELIVCLRINDYFRPGSYSLNSPDATFRPGQGGWLRWSDKKQFSTAEIKERIREGAIEYIIEEADVVVVGTVSSVRDIKLPGAPYEDREYTMRIESLPKGNIAGETIKFVTHKGLFADAWIPYVPAAVQKPNQKWYVFLKEKDGFYYPFAGANGLLRISKEGLIYDERLTRRKSAVDRSKMEMSWTRSRQMTKASGQEKNRKQTIEAS